MYVSQLGRISTVAEKVLGKDGCYYQDTTNELESGCFYHFASDSSELKRLRKIVVGHYNCVHGQNSVTSSGSYFLLHFN